MVDTEFGQNNLNSGAVSPVLAAFSSILGPSALFWGLSISKKIMKNPKNTENAKIIPKMQKMKKIH